MSARAARLAIMAECIHGLELDRCDICSPAEPVTRGSGGSKGTSWSGKTFALVYAPSLRGDTFLHLNREGDHWKFRWYPAPDRAYVEVAQSSKTRSRMELNLSDVELVHEIGYLHSSNPGGVKVTNAQYWFDEIARVNAAHGIG